MDIVNHLEGRLLFAVPKKGRLQQPTLDLLAGSDIQFRREARLDVALVQNLPVALVFLPAADIPAFVGEGKIDIGITGRDQVAEHEAHSPPTETAGVQEVLDLGFGRCSLKVQVPENGPLRDPKELIGKNVVTSFTGLAKTYFAQLEGHLQDTREDGIDSIPERKIKTKIKFVSGSVEAACLLGLGDAIVDLVESGTTMKAAGLIDIDTLVDSTAILIKSKRPSNPAMVELIASRLRGVITAQKYVLCQYNIARESLEAATKITPGRRAPTVTALETADWVAVSSMVEAKNVATVMDDLAKVGATDILVLKIMNSRIS